MKKVERVEIKKLGINGEGIGYIERKIIFINGVLPGEIVDVEITKQNRSYLEGIVVKIVEPSKQRIEPKCEKFGECQGCSLLHLKYGGQLQYKKEAIRESLRKYTNYDLQKTVFKDVIGATNLEGTITSVNLPVVEYRNQITFGIYQRDTKQLTVLTECFKIDYQLRKCLKELQRIFTEEKVAIYNDRQKKGIRFLKARKLGKGIQIVIITGKDGVAKKVLDKIEKLPMINAIFMSRNTTRYQEFEEERYTKVSGYSRQYVTIENQPYAISIKSKLMENVDMYSAKRKAILSMLEDSDKILSLYCGWGFVELGSDKTIVAVDNKKDQIEDANWSKEKLQKSNITFQFGKIEDRVVYQAKKKTFDTFLIQKERDGLGDEIVKSIILSKVQNVIYTCDSHSTLAKDLAELERYYHLERIIALDTYVHTPYVTTIVKLRRK